MAEPIVTRAWATVEIKRAGNAEQRMITGIATTPETDRQGDIVESKGLTFKNPLPLLRFHRHSEPVGWARLDKATDDGIAFTAQFADVAESGKLKERVDEAWQEVKAGLVRGISIGFKAKEAKFMDDGGMRFLKGEVVELSLVTVPANASATIATIKSIDAALLGNAREMPGASGTQRNTEIGATKMPTTLAEQASMFQTQLEAAKTGMKALMQKAADDGRTFDDAEQKEFDGLERQCNEIDGHLQRVQKFELMNKTALVPVQGGDLAAGSRSREPITYTPPAGDALGHALATNTPIRVRPNCPPTTGFIRLCLAMMAGKGNRSDALSYAKKRTDWHSSTPELLTILSDDDIMYHLRAAVPAGTTYDSTWAGPLVYAQNFTDAFAEFLRPLTIIGRFNSLRRVPFNVRIPRVTGGTSGNWVGEGAPKPVTSMTLDTITMTWAKAAAIVILTEELVRFSNPAAEDMVRADLAKSITQFVDRQFVDPSVAAVTGVSPGSITNGITPITPTGVNMAAFRADVKTLMNQLLVVNQSLAGGYWIMTQQQALSLSIAQNSLGQTIYPSIDPSQGGTLLGYPVIASENIPATGGSPADGYPLIFAIGPEILLADDGTVTVDASREASLQADSAPDSPPTASTNMLSLWQLNMLGLRAERWITWSRRRTSAVAWIQNAKYAE
jgi:HK97 family phage prohead protease